MSMTRKHFQALADIVAEKPATPEALAKRLAEFCKSENSNFNKERFLAACKI